MNSERRLNHAPAKRHGSTKHMLLIARLCVPSVFLLIGAPTVAWAQATAVITGVVRDGTGAVLPGVTVEASSPALIEKVRTVVTDGQGQYRIIDLRAGTYSVTFVLPGFSTVKRDGVELTGNFTATVNATLQVGALEETITVTGESPLIDTQTVTETRALPNELIDALPTGRTFQNLSILVPGVNVSLAQHDVGGSTGEGNGFRTLSVNGSRSDQMPLIFNGMRFNNMNNTGGGYNGGLLMVTGSVEEMTITTSGIGAEWMVSGVTTNSIPKEGGNTFRGYLFANFSNGSMQSNNLSQDLIDRGVRAVNRNRKLWDVNPGFGGPFVRDKLWFYAGYRYYGAQSYMAGAFLNRNPDAPQYCATLGGCLYGGVLVPDSRDLSQQAWGGDRWNRALALNLTWQATPKNKLTYFLTQTERKHTCIGCGPALSPEAARVFTPYPEYLTQATWSNPWTNRLLFEGGITLYNETFHHIQDTSLVGPRGFGYGPDVPISKVEASTGTSYGAPNSFNHNGNHQYNMRFSVNYVTGSHAFKVGMTDMWGTRDFRFEQNQAQTWTFTRGIPTSITQTSRPWNDIEKLKAALALYVQDKWTIRNVTLNLGLRFDYHHAYVPAQVVPATLWVPARQYDAVKGVPIWKDFSPRAGFAWDIFGTGKTVARFNYARYVASESVATATANNPLNTSISSATRRWTDADNDFFPDCDLRNRAANGECGPLSAPLGDLNVITRYDPAILRGWGVRPSDYEVVVGVEQQLMPRVAVDAQFTRHAFGDFFATQNLAQPPSVFSRYCVTAPVDPRLPGGGGNQICGFADVDAAGFGVRPNNVVTKASNFGDMSDVYTGMSVNLTARFASGGFLSAGVSAGHEVTDMCDLITKASPGGPLGNSSAGQLAGSQWGSYPSTLYCRVEPPIKADVKVSAVYPLPWWGLTTSAILQSRPGPEIRATHVITAANLSTTTLTRPPLAGSATVDLIPPGTVYGDRLNQIDLRFGKVIRAGRARVNASVDVYNLLNANTALGFTNRYGPTWLTPTQIVTGRFVKVGAQVDF